MADLLKMAEKLESEILAKIKFIPTHVIGLDGLLCDTYARMCPKPIDYFNRRDLVHIFNLMTKEIYGNLLFHATLEISLCNFAFIKIREVSSIYSHVIGSNGTNYLIFLFFMY